MNNFSILEPYTATLTAGQRLSIASRGSVIAVSSASATFYVEIGGQRAEVRQGFVLRSRVGAQFDGFQIVNGDTPQTVTLMVGDGDIDLPIPSVVGVVDVSKETTKAGDAFSAWSYLGGLASNYNHIILFNPAGSNHNLFVSELEVSDWSGAGYFVLGWTTTSGLGTFYATPKNKKLGGSADVVTEVRNHQATGQLLSSATTYFFKSLDAVNKGKRHVFTRGDLMIPPGVGLVVQSSSVNVTYAIDVQYTKEVI